MADTKISQKTTKTKTRAATHSPRLASSLRCPKCSGRQVLESVAANTVGTHWCATCGHAFTPAEAA